MSGRSSISRREFITGAFQSRNTALAATGALAWTHLLDTSRGASESLRPPGAQPEESFVASCIKCGQCVEACPFDTLKLATADDQRATGVPYFEPRQTPCFMCEDAPCITACPTDALIEDTPIEEARMGLAVLIDQETCLAFQGLRCEVCYRSCPLMGKALRLDMQPQERTGKHAFFLPVVDSEHCTGCGKCERTCITEEAAIKVLPVALAKGKLGEHYRFGWKEETFISRDFEAPRNAPEIPEWGEESLRDVLEKLDDLSGIEEP
ncbi:MAG: ferredoxin-type protein NapG [Deltaproteobacteria bacterium]|nr:ferredoxin-type protein NapG [Deltaproteobacteria bacterium]MBW2421383.1 ferredoxin-type protein NapG [Deltaproteobacteria bacterium]